MTQGAVPDHEALIDGAGQTRMLLTIVVPVAMPRLIAATIFAFTVSLGALLYPMALIYSADQLPLTAGIVTTLIKGDVFQWGSIMAGALMAAAPPVMLYAFLTDCDSAGLEAGAAKGESRRSGGEVAQHVAGTAAAGMRGPPARVNPRCANGSALTRRGDPGPRGAMTENRLVSSTLRRSSPPVPCGSGPGEPALTAFPSRGGPVLRYPRVWEHRPSPRSGG